MKSLKLKIKRGPKGIIYLMLVLIITIRFFESFGVPHSFFFVLDFLNIYLLIRLIWENKIWKYLKLPLVKWQMIVFIIAIFVALFNNIKILQIIWALRNLVRFLIFFSACSEYLNLNNVEEIFGILKKLFWINSIFIIFEYIVLGLTGDYLGGLFGTALGANTYMNIFLIVVFCYEICQWLERKEKLRNLILISALSLIECVLCEIKIFVLEMAVIILCVLIIDMFVERKVQNLLKLFFIVIIASIGLVLAINAIGKMYPNFSDFFTAEGFMYATMRESGYSGVGDLNRLTAITMINKIIFPVADIKRMFGMGLGSAEYSTGVKFLTSKFYEMYNGLHYYWFSHAWMYLECGYFGLIGYIISFYSQALNGIKSIRKENKNRFSYLLISVIMCLITLILYLYNQSLRLEIAYLLYFGIAVMMIIRKDNINSER